MKHIPIEVRLFVTTILVSILGLTFFSGQFPFSLSTVILILVLSLPTAFFVFIISSILTLVRSAQNKGELQFGVKRAKKLTRIEEMVLVLILLPIAGTCLYILSGGYIFNPSDIVWKGLLEVIVIAIGGMPSIYIFLYLLYSRLIAK